MLLPLRRRHLIELSGGWGVYFATLNKRKKAEVLTHDLWHQVMLESIVPSILVSLTLGSFAPGSQLPKSPEDTQQPHGEVQVAGNWDLLLQLCVWVWKGCALQPRSRLG